MTVSIFGISGPDLDGIDRGILRLLGENARNTTPVDIGRRLPVSDGTVRNWIERLEVEGVIEGYLPVIDYAKAGYPLTVVFGCDAGFSDREPIVEDALALENVVAAREFATGGENAEVTAVVEDVADITETAARLHEAGLDVRNERIVRRNHRDSCGPFESDDRNDRAGN